MGEITPKAVVDVRHLAGTCGTSDGCRSRVERIVAAFQIESVVEIGNNIVRADTKLAK